MLWALGQGGLHRGQDQDLPGGEPAGQRPQAAVGQPRLRPQDARVEPGAPAAFPSFPDIRAALQQASVLFSTPEQQSLPSRNKLSWRVPMGVMSCVQVLPSLENMVKAAKNLRAQAA